MNKEKYTKLRQQLGTQAYVASLVGVCRTTIAKRESGAWKITPEASLALQAVADGKRFAP